MKAEIISIGDELLIGQVINTNATYLGTRLGEIGIGVDRVTTVGDAKGAILRAFKRAWAEEDVVIVTGGLGPTHDDISKAVVAQFFGKQMKLHAPTLTAIRKRFSKAGYAKMPESNIGQAMIPTGFQVLRNHVGTAPGLLYSEKGKTFVILPGVPHEMQWIMQDSVLKYLRNRYKGKGLEVIRHRTLLTTGIGESSLAELIGDVKDILEPGATLAYLPKSPIVRLRISVRGKSERTVALTMLGVEIRIRCKIAKFIYGVDDETLQSAIVDTLRETQSTISTAESCTGGLLAAHITSVPGASDVFKGAVVSYDNEVKIRELSVPKNILTKHGAVSEEVARLMAEGVRKKLGTTFGLSITGIAGPTGGTRAKPVGTVWIGLAQSGHKPIAKRFRFIGDRSAVRERSTINALDMLRRRIHDL
jgi:nicotinamide-nucleotide amidase